MSSSFQPILSSKSAKAAPEKFRLKILPQAATTPAFTPTVSKSTPPQTLSSAATAQPCNNAPTLTLERDGDRVKIIHVKCACGQTMQLQCDYPSDPA